MTSLNSLKTVLSEFHDPYLDGTWGATDVVLQITDKANSVDVVAKLPYPASLVKANLLKLLQQHCRAKNIDININLQLPLDIFPRRVQNGLKPLRNIKNTIAIASGKGGVGKSTIAINLAAVLAKGGARVGLLDADIYGPNQGLMLGMNQMAKTTPQNKILPIEAHGLQTMSMAYLVDERTPMVWRGPMVSRALQQLVFDTEWDDLDFLIIDMPPGTGDVQLTLAQKIPITGVVVVATPQPVAILDARKGIEMLRKVRVPILGLIENMSTYHCPKCEHVDPIFGTEGAAGLARDYDLPLIGSIPLNTAIRQAADQGHPLVIEKPEHLVSQLYIDAACRMVGLLSKQMKDYSHLFPQVVVESDSSI